MAPPISRASSRGPKGTESAAREKYRKELVVERLTLHASSRYVTQAMQDGIDREPFARMLYEAETQQPVQQIGFVLHPIWDWFGCSADGLCGEDGGVEFKCPTEIHHSDYIDDIDALIDEYKWQCLGNMVCCRRQWWDLASFNPYFPDALKLIRTRIHRSDYSETISKIEDAVFEFNAEIEAKIAALNQPSTVWEIPQAEEEIPLDAYDPSKSFVENCAFLDEVEIVP